MELIRRETRSVGIYVEERPCDMRRGDPRRYDYDAWVQTMLARGTDGDDDGGGDGGESAGVGTEETAKDEQFGLVVTFCSLHSPFGCADLSSLL
ncbi:ion channel [Pseudozyma hubeiensis SY62]|uniref:Ion channel n=1 Tax=Pseudozyma hubeiensis (strain SY62) TaxID=1305764 RepID=R9PEM7_PSEHS|nr:ion channel [Pseudozyma hubeiensis SY62]GAC99809.1 ion channel [Pseudozyma hubeiensis SY62]